MLFSNTEKGFPEYTPPRNKLVEGGRKGKGVGTFRNFLEGTATGRMAVWDAGTGCRGDPSGQCDRVTLINIHDPRDRLLECLCVTQNTLSAITFICVTHKRTNNTHPQTGKLRPAQVRALELGKVCKSWFIC